MLDTSAFAGWIFGAACIILAIASAAQGALFYIDRMRLRHLLDHGVGKAKAVTELLDSPTRTIATIQFTLTLALAAAAASAYWFVAAWWDTNRAVSLAFGVGALLVLILVQMGGRLLAVSRPERIALALARPVEWLSHSPILLPVVVLERWAGVGRSSTPAEAEERLRHLVQDNAELDSEEREMIASVIELGDQPVREVMVPRIDIIAISAASNVRQVLDRIIDTGHSRIPTYDETIDRIVGVIYAKDLLKHLRDGALDAPVQPLAREPRFIPETKKVDDLLHEMQAQRVHLAIVVDEYGGTAGLITIEDLIEEIVGEIQDEYDVEEAPIERISETEAIFDARVSIRDVNDTLDVDIDDEDFDTLGGLVYHRLGNLPSVGDEVRVDGVAVAVLTTSGRRVRKVRVTRVSSDKTAMVEMAGELNH